MNKNIYTALCVFLIFVTTGYAQVTGVGDMWTWMHGESTTTTPAVYGTQGVADPNTTPYGVYTPCTWRDPSGNFWMFGGLSTGSGFMNDLWKYDPVSNQWTWMHGSQTPNHAGSYGTQGVAAPTNMPPARYSPSSWTDAAGNLWMFGGLGPAGFFNDLWKYNTTTNQWTWVHGANAINAAGSYGTQGVAAATNAPCARQSGGFWTDNAGNLWLFGGYNNGVVGGQVAFSDLWKYDPTNNMWTWVHGPNVHGQAAVFGTRGVAAPGNRPGARSTARSWTDATGNLWLMGGQLWTSGYQGPLNDLWKYDPVTNQWAWMHGSQSARQNGTYGTQGVAAASNTPGGRFNIAGWTDIAGNLWLFGGTGQAVTGTAEVNLQDLWKYDIATNEWTWISGSNLGNQPGVYGTKGQPDPANYPGGRGSVISWSDLSGNFWLFGGSGQAASGSGYLNDLWRLAPCGDMQSLVSGILGADTTFCQGNTYILDATFPGATYLWSTGATTATITVSTTGNYWVRISDASGCTGRDSVLVTVVPPPDVDLGPDQSVCSRAFPLTLNSWQPAGSSYLWSNGLSDTQMTVTRGGTYWLHVSYAGCEGSDTITITSVTEPDVTIGADTTICASVPARIGMEVPGATYLWSTGSTDPFIFVSVTDAYWLQVDLQGCVTADTTQITAVEDPQIDLGPDRDICPEQEIILDPGTGAAFQWSTGETTPTYTATRGGHYSVRVTSVYGCTGSDTVFLRQKNFPTVTLDHDTTVCEETPLKLVAQSTDAESYLWSDGSTEQVLIVTSGGEYVATAINQCGSASDTIEVRQIFCDIWVPNVFTPNGDGRNDVFRVLGNLGRINGFGLGIYNRWGERVFHTSDKMQGWDGLHKGSEALMGTYVYMLEYSFEGEPFLQKGNFVLIR